MAERSHIIMLKAIVSVTESITFHYSKETHHKSFNFSSLHPKFTLIYSPNLIHHPQILNNTSVPRLHLHDLQ
jgi:hypothetical protein